MTQQFHQHLQRAANETLLRTQWNSDSDQAAPGHVGGTGRAATLVVVGNAASNYLKNQADFVADGSDDDEAIQAAIDALPSTRNAKSIVVLLDEFNISDAISQPHHVIIDAWGAKVNMANGVNKNMVVNATQTEAGTDNRLEIWGGIWNGNYGNSNNGVKAVIEYTEVDGCFLWGLEVTNSPGEGIKIRGDLAGGANDQRQVCRISDCWTHANGGSGVRSLSAMRRTIIDNLISNDNAEDGLAVQHSELIVNGYFGKGNGRSGLRTQNIHTANLSGLNILDSGLTGIDILGFVDGRIEGICRDSSKGTVSIAYTSGGTTQPQVGQTLTGETSGATMVLVDIVLDSGSWAGGNAAGTFYGRSKTGIFESETLKRGTDLNVATIAGDTSSTSGVFSDVRFDTGNTQGYGDNRHLDIKLLAGQSIRGRDNGATPTEKYAVEFKDGSGGENISGDITTGPGATSEVLWPVGIERLPFTSGGTYEIKIGDTITGATSTETGVVTSIYTVSGTWAGGDQVGVLWYKTRTGAFQSETLDVGANTNVATIAGDSTPTQIQVTHNPIDGPTVIRNLAVPVATELTIKGGVITVTQSNHSVDTEGDASTDDLNTIRGGYDGMFLVLTPANNARDIVLKDGADNIQLRGAIDLTMTKKKSNVKLQKQGNNWIRLSDSNNDAVVNDATHTHA